MALVAPAMADMSATFQALGETTRAGVMCHSEGLLRFNELTATEPDVRAYARAHPAEVEQWELAGMRSSTRTRASLARRKTALWPKMPPFGDRQSMPIPQR